MAEAEPATPESVTSKCGDKPTCIIILGMAGSGKTTFVQVCVNLSKIAIHLNQYHKHAITESQCTDMTDSDTVSLCSFTFNGIFECDSVSLSLYHLCLYSDITIALRLSL